MLDQSGGPTTGSRCATAPGCCTPSSDTASTRGGACSGNTGQVSAKALAEQERTDPEFIGYSYGLGYALKRPCRRMSC